VDSIRALGGQHPEFHPYPPHCASIIIGRKHHEPTKHLHFLCNRDAVAGPARRAAASPNKGRSDVSGLREADKTFIRRIEGALIPNGEGKEFGADATCLPTRSVGSCREIVTLAGDELKITQPGVASTTEQGPITEHQAAVTEIVFKRAK
jgi:hypothetical protein